MIATAALRSDEVSTEVAADPDRVWALIADVTQMGRWSSVCRRCEWTGGAVGPGVGVRFVGHNRRGPARWSRVCEIVACDQGHEFAFRTLFKGVPSTCWRYRLERTPTGTLIVESYEMISMPRWVQLLSRVPGMKTKAKRDTRRDITSTLERIRAAAERADP
jgi:uncharacterized protein YndB with AHSA1/START domain